MEYSGVLALERLVSTGMEQGVQDKGNDHDHDKGVAAYKANILFLFLTRSISALRPLTGVVRHGPM